MLLLNYVDGALSLIGLQSRYNLLDRSLEFVLQPACWNSSMGCHCRKFSYRKIQYTRESAAVLKPVSRGLSVIKHSNIDEITAIQKILVELLFRISPAEQMKRLDEVFKLTEIPFPCSYICIFERHIGKNIVPKKFEPVASDCSVSA
ncbi:unnamed protein product [Rhizophagus irregularis]|nr:unnamed protein product [Rhizophagus irregularis]